MLWSGTAVWNGRDSVSSIAPSHLPRVMRCAVIGDALWVIAVLLVV
jgi:hypothetical protein